MNASLALRTKGNSGLGAGRGGRSAGEARTLVFHLHLRSVRRKDGFDFLVKEKEKKKISLRVVE